MSETIAQVFERKILDARVEVQNAYVNKERVIAEADKAIAVATAKRDLLDNLAELNWKMYAKNELESK